MLCNTNCAQDPVALAGGGCRLTTRTGGIDRFVFARCDTDFTLLTDINEWSTKVAAGDIVFSGQVLGQKPKGTFTKKKLASCKPEQVTGVTRQITFTDANADNDNFTDYDFWNDKQENQDIYIVGYITCEELFYGFYSDWSLEIDDTRPEDTNEEFKWDGTILFNSLTAPAPIDLTGISTVIGAGSGS